MVDFAHIFSSYSRTKILEVLFYQDSPLRLREIQALSGVEINPINLAIKQLAKENIVKKIKKNGIVGYKLNNRSKSYDELSLVLTSMKRAKLIKRKENIQLIINGAIKHWAKYFNDYE